MKLQEVQREIREIIDDIMVVDSHEHFGLPLIVGNRIYDKMDLTLFLEYGYLSGDIVSSGIGRRTNRHPLGEMISFMSGSKSIDKKTSMKKWKHLKNSLHKIQNTIYYRYLLTALHDLYDLDGKALDDDTYKTITQRIRSKSKDSIEWGLEILDRMNIHKVILDITGGAGGFKECLPSSDLAKDERLVHVVRMDGFISGTPPDMTGFNDKRFNSFDCYLGWLDEFFDIVVKSGVVGIKSGLAYQRIISYDNITKSRAERIFSRGINKVGLPQRKDFQDFMMRTICEKCAEYKLPIQIHTGIQFGDSNVLTNSKPTNLTSLFQEFPEVTFDILHGGYPYMQEAGLLAKYFPNVYLDACWLPHISSAAYKRGLDEWLDILPVNKILAWGGDHLIIEHSYASLMWAKDLIAQVLAMKVYSGYFNIKAAITIARKILGENAIGIFRL